MLTTTVPTLTITKRYFIFCLFLNLLLSLGIFIVSWIFFMVFFALFLNGTKMEGNLFFDTTASYSIVATLIVFFLKSLRDWLYITTTKVEAGENCFTVTLGGFGINRLAVPMNIMIMNEIRQNPVEAFFGLARINIGYLGLRELRGVDYKEAVAFGQSLSSSANKTTYSSYTTTTEKTVSQ